MDVDIERLTGYVRDLWWLAAAAIAAGWWAIRNAGDSLWGPGQNVSRDHFDKVMAEVRDDLQRGTERMQANEARVDQHRERIIRLETAEKIRWEPMERAFERVHQRLDKIEQTLANLDGRMEAKVDR